MGTVRTVTSAASSGASSNGARSINNKRKNVFFVGALVAQAVLLAAFFVAQSPSSLPSSSQYLLFSASSSGLPIVNQGGEGGGVDLRRLHDREVTSRSQGSLRRGGDGVVVEEEEEEEDDDDDEQQQQQQPLLPGGGDNAAALLALVLNSPLVVPPGQPPNLPRLDVPTVTHESGDKNGDNDNKAANAAAARDAKADAQRSIYGGKGDGKHLGGFTDFDPQGVAPVTWTKMITDFGVKSVLDVGCGRGISARWFLEHNLTVLCVEGSKDAIRQSFLPPDHIVEHDYSRGPWWPADTYDAAWSVEFLEHVSRPYMRNYIQTLRKAALIFVTSSRWGGWHHVEIHNDEWWIRKFSSYGFVYDDKLSTMVRNWARKERKSNYTLPNGDKPGPQHVSMSMKVFINPAVASLPQHEHLFPEHGCLGNARPGHTWSDGGLPFLPRKCGVGREGRKETPLLESFLPLNVDMSMHERWVEAIRAGIQLPESKDKESEASKKEEPPKEDK